MDLVRLSLVNQLALRLSSDGRARQSYLAQDRSSGRIFTLPRALALALRRVQAAERGDAEARKRVGREELRDVSGLLGQIRAARGQDRLTRRRFNPVFASFPLIDLGPLQPRMQPLARALVGPGFLVFMAALLGAALFLGIRSDWAIFSSYRNMFSLEAIATFGLVAPVLKIFHEAGHALTATRYGVRLRKGGLYLIGLYPMPYVDCTEADVSARRRHRIAISLAGILVDVTVGLIAFVLWYLVAGSYWQVLIGHVFVFSTLNSVLFNANPLTRLDGYYVMTDLLRRRNLATRASATLADLRLWAMTTGLAGNRPREPRHWGLVAYSVGSFLYRLKILYVIGFALLPRYLGLGIVVMAWGAVAMFVAPLMQDEIPRVHLDDAARRRRRWMRAGLAGGLVVALGFVPLPYHLRLDVAADVEGHYQLTTQSAGFLQALAPGGPIGGGTRLAALENPALRDRAEVLDANLAGARAAYESVRGDHPAKAAMAARQVMSLSDQVAVSAREIAGLTLTAPGDGVFVPSRLDRAGAFLPSGTALGAFLPVAGGAVLSGPFPERYVDKFQQGPVAAELRIAGEYLTLDPSAAALRTIIGVDRASGTRIYQLTIPAELTPASLAGRPGALRLTFAAEPLVCHIKFLIQGLAARFREAQMADRSGI
ncbi:hypothetical protein JMM59_02695 [Rhodovulum sulfidophilum]|uniref:site-2 protease family protein n=1 Tax=Rhodovulum sulfidophilum TaxID=35806 RepID=UPI00192159EA|nr:site-2 protease family protein [Rhodovulum sulfidophilum]MBL3563930.1 hypothetical protein [Rhodovulum sulfidophilum]